MGHILTTCEQTLMRCEHTLTACKHTLTACDVSGRTSRCCGSWSRVMIHRCVRTCCRLTRWCGSMCNIRETRSLAVDDTTSQFPPLSANLPSPIRARICSAESSGPFANGVWLHAHSQPVGVLTQVHTASATDLAAESDAVPWLH